MNAIHPLLLLAAPLLQDPDIDRDPPGPGRTVLPPEPVVLEAETSTGWFTIEVMANGRGPYSMILDTGAMGMVVFADLADELALEVTGTTPGGDPSNVTALELDTVALSVLQIGDATFEQVDAVSWSPPAGLPPDVRGIVGLPVFRDCLLTLDKSGGQIRIEKGALPEPDGRRVLPFRRDEFGIVTIDLEVAGEVVDAHIDSGNGRSVLLPKRFRDLVALVPGTERTGRGMRASGPIEFTSGVLDGDLQIGALFLTRPEVRFDPKLDHANLGATFLDACTLTIDQENLRLRVSHERRGRSPAAPRRTALPADTVVMPVDLSSTRPVVEVMLNGRGPYRLILDTGAGRTVLNADLAAELGLEVTGQSRIGDPSNPRAVEVDVVALPVVQVGDATFEEIEAVAWELPRGMRLPGTRGILGIPTFADCLITFDYGKSEVRLEKGALPPPDGRRVLEMKGGMISAPLHVLGQVVDAHLDTGNGGGYVLPKALEAKLPLVEGSEFQGQGMRASGPVPFTGGVVDASLRVGDVVVDKPRVNFDSKLTTGNLGRAFFEQCVVTIDQANGRLRITPNEEEPADPARRVVDRSGKRRLGVSMMPGDGTLTVVAVAPSSLGERAGLKAGDVLLEVDGKGVSFGDADPLTEALNADDAFTLTVERDGERVELEVPAGS